MKLILPIFVSLFSIWYIFFNGFDYYVQLLDGESFTGKMNPKIVNLDWKVYNKNNDTFTTVNYKDKVAYLDFWSTSCGACFVKFPELEELYQQYKNNPDVLIQAINIPIERDTAGMAFYMIERRNDYTFPVVIGTEAMRSAFKVEAYPTIVILKNNKIVFRGRSELAKSALEDIINSRN